MALSLPLLGDRQALHEAKHYDKKQLEAKWSEWLRAGIYMLTLSFIGMGAWPLWVVALGMVLVRWQKQREEAVAMLAILVTCNAFVRVEVIPVDLQLVLLPLTAIALFVYRKNLIIKRVVLVIFAYILFTVFMAMFSDESLKIQFISMRSHWGIIYFILPLWCFINHSFDIDKFMKIILIYFVVICLYYGLDAYVVRGPFFVSSNSYQDFSTLSDISIFRKFIPRKYPYGMNMVCVIPYILARHYSLSKWQWLILLVGFAATKSMTFTFGFFLTMIVFQGQFKRFAKYLIICGAVGFALYSVDKNTGGYLRIASTVEQFNDLQNAQDEEDLSMFGSQRMAQVLPRYEALREQGCLMQGFGFLHPTLTTLPRYRIYNEFANPENAEEVASAVENSQFSTIIHMGIIGLLVQTGVFLLLYFMVKDKPYSQYLLSTLLCSSVIGMAGGYGLNIWRCTLWIGLILGFILLLDRRNPKREVKVKNNYVESR